jgi:hypothetical protein
MKIVHYCSTERGCPCSSSSLVGVPVCPLDGRPLGADICGTTECDIAVVTGVGSVVPYIYIRWRDFEII